MLLLLASAIIILMAMSILIVNVSVVAIVIMRIWCNKLLVRGEGFVPICPKKSQKTGVEFSLQMCKKGVVKILGSLPVCKLYVRKG